MMVKTNCSEQGLSLIVRSLIASGTVMPCFNFGFHGWFKHFIASEGKVLLIDVKRSKSNNIYEIFKHLGKIDCFQTGHFLRIYSK